MIDNRLKKQDQAVLAGSSFLLKKEKDVPERTAYMIDNMALNKAFLSIIKKNGKESHENLLDKYKLRYAEYRRLWNDQPEECIKKGIYGEDMLENNYVPLCIDIEVASICDLACPFCYRESLATPDKIIKRDLYFQIVDQAVEMGVPSLKLNWRGEPLMHNALPEMILYAKQKGILEVIINTNATHLSEKMAHRLIDSGLDFMIYSFDGGTKETYESMRPGRFRKNTFEEVYENIVRFSKIKKKTGAKFPYTKIQMILTDQTHKEQNNFFDLFDDFVDEVTVTQYSERGGSIRDLSLDDQVRYKKLCEKKGLPEGSPYMLHSNGEISISKSRSACEQPFQRIMLTYDGRAAMCCFDWGAMHPVGYVSSDCFSDEDADKRIVLDNIDKKRKGFSLMPNVVMPPKFNQPKKTVQSLKDIWTGNEMKKVRSAHGAGEIDSVKICEKCTFKDTYNWEDGK
jgi:MoaA/NifB/PqqE/SkfB family radical SAM enzyme